MSLLDGDAAPVGCNHSLLTLISITDRLNRWFSPISASTSSRKSILATTPIWFTVTSTEKESTTQCNSLVRALIKSIFRMRNSSAEATGFGGAPLG